MFDITAIAWGSVSACACASLASIFTLVALRAACWFKRQHAIHAQTMKTTNTSGGIKTILHSGTAELPMSYEDGSLASTLHALSGHSPTFNCTLSGTPECEFLPMKTTYSTSLVKYTLVKPLVNCASLYLLLHATSSLSTHGKEESVLLRSSTMRSCSANDSAIM